MPANGTATRRMHLSSERTVMVRNSAAALLIGAAPRAATLVSFFLLARVLPPRELGTLAFVLAVIDVARQLTEVGLGPASIRRLSGTSRETWHSAITAGLWIRLAAAALAYLAIAGLTFLPALSAMRPLFLIAGVVLFAGALTNTVTVPFQASLEMSRLWPGHGLSSIIFLGLVVWGTYHEWSVQDFVIATLVREAVLTCGVFAAFRSQFTFGFATVRDEALLLLSSAAVIGLLQFIVLLYFRLDVVMLQLLRGSTAVGQYSLAFRATEAFLLIAAAVSSSVFPRLAAIAEQGSAPLLIRAFAPIYQLSCLAGITIALSVSIATPLAARFFPPPYQEAALLTRVLIWSVAFMFANIQSADALVALGDAGAVTRIALVNLGLNVILNLLLIPAYGALGAVFATVATEGLNAAMQAAYLRWRFGLRFSRAALLAALLLGSVGAFSLAALSPLVGALAFFGTLIVLGASVHRSRPHFLLRGPNALC